MEFLYICESPVLNGYKIGYHSGHPNTLHDRYRTPFGNCVSFTLFSTNDKVQHEAIVHRIFEPYKITNEIFLKNDKLYLFYCFILKCTTGSNPRLFSKDYGKGFKEIKSDMQREAALNERILKINPCEAIHMPDCLIDDIELEEINERFQYMNLKKNDSNSLSQKYSEILDAIPSGDGMNDEDNIEMIDDIQEIKDETRTPVKLEMREEIKILEELKKEEEKKYKEVDLRNNYINNPFSRWAAHGRIRISHFG